MSIRSALRRSPALVTAYRRARAAERRVRWRLGPQNFPDMVPDHAVRMAYQIVLGRDPDAAGRTTYVDALTQSSLSLGEMVEKLRGSAEFMAQGFSAKMLYNSIHVGRCQFIRSLPPGRRILDLGGTHLNSAEGALVTMGYPYPFDQLTIVDLPSDQRHAIYRSSEGSDVVQTRLGPVGYRYHSMTDLAALPDGSIDLVYSGQSIEHVTPREGRHVLDEIARLLRPGGHVGIDTPNARVTRLQQEAFIDPDHKVEYRLDELSAMVQAAGLCIIDTKGLNYAGRSLAAGRFDADEVSRNAGMFAAAEDCYILCLVAQKRGCP